MPQGNGVNLLNYGVASMSVAMQTNKLCYISVKMGYNPYEYNNLHRLT